MFSVTCAGLEAPVMTVLTCGFFKHHARAEPRQRRPEICRDLRQLFHFRETLTRFVVLKLLAQPIIIFQRNPRPARITSRCISRSAVPDASGDQIVVPRPNLL